MSGLEGLRLAVAQSNAGVTGDQHSPWARASNTPGAMLAVGSKWSDSVGQTATAWRNVNAPVSHRDPATGQTVERPPTKGETAARVLRAAQGTIGGIMGGLGLAKDALDVGFASLTAPLAAIAPSLPAATVMSPYLGTPHAHPAHPPSGPPPVPPTPCPSLGMTTLGPTPRVLINSMPAARCDDIGLAPTCMGLPPAWFKIKTGSSNVFIGGARAARLGDICVACKNIPDPPTIPAGKVMAAIGKAAGVASTAMHVAGIAAGALGIAADVAEAAVEDDASMAAAKALAAAMGAVQMALDQAKAAVEKTMWKDPTLPPTGSMGAIIDPSHATVLIGGFPMINIPDPVGAVLNRLKRYKARAPAANDGCGKEGEPVDVVTGANLEECSDLPLHHGLGVAWIRYYDSSGSSVRGPLGYGWRHEFECMLRINLDGIEYIPASGSPVYFSPLSVDEPSTSRDGWTLFQVDASTYRLLHARAAAREFVVIGAGNSARLTRVFSGRDQIRFVYDRHDRLANIVGGIGGSIAIDYDSRGLLSQLTEVRETSLPSTVLAYEYDSDENLTKWTDALGNAATLDYDGQHRLTRKGDRRGYSYLYAYDDRGRCIHTWGEDGLYDVRLNYLDTARCTQAIHPDGGVWTYFFDENGTIVRIVDPYGKQRQRVADISGKVLAEFDAAGNEYRIVYDAAGGIIGRQDPFGHVQSDLSDLRRHNHLALVAPSTALEWENGAILRPQDIRPAAPIKTLRDRLGRTVEECLDPTVKRHWQYDGNGNVLAYQDSDGAQRRLAYASWNLLEREVDPLGNVTRYAYSRRERVVRAVDPGGTLSEYVYDLRDNIVSVNRHGRVRETYVRDATDNLVEKRDGSGQTLLSFEIGQGNLMSDRRLASGEHHRFEYDKRGRLTLATTDLCEVRLGYGADRRPISDLRNGLGVRYEKSKQGRHLRLSVLDQYEITYKKSASNKLTIVDPTGAQHSVTANLNGTIVIESSNGAKETRQYTKDGKCISKTRVRIREWPLWMRQYTYSPEGDLTAVSDSLSGGSSYEYDAAHRLIGEAQSDGALAHYRYDAAGNLLAHPGLSGAVVGAGNRLMAANGAAYIYDQRDHIASCQSSEGVTRFEYDSCDRLVRCVTPRGEWHSTYDPLGRRITKNWNGATTEYYWDENRLAVEKGSTGRIRVYLYLDIDALVPYMFIDFMSASALAELGQCYFVVTNQIGAPIRVEDVRGSIVWQAKIEPYGSTSVQSKDNFEFNLRWPGHYEDVELGLFYNRFRYYSPILGRYIQPDPLGIVGGINLYAYSHNPLTSVDLFGLHPPPNEAEDGEEGTATGQNEEKAKGGRRPQDPAGEAALIAAVNNESLNNPSGLTKRQQGPFVAGVRDSVTGEISVRRNTTGPPEDMHPIISDRVAAEKKIVAAVRDMDPADRNGIRSASDDEIRGHLANNDIPETSGGMDNVEAMRNVDQRRRYQEELAQRAAERQAGQPAGSGWDGTERNTPANWDGMQNEAGSHAEVHALNDRLQAREGTPNAVTDPSQLDQFQTDVARNGTDTPGPRCHHCENITSGTTPTQRLADADAHRDDRMH